MFRGKGDYHRLGHGTDDHVRKPKRVTALQGKKIVSVACGSLHCVACTDTGKATNFPYVTHCSCDVNLVENLYTYVVFVRCR